MWGLFIHHYRTESKLRKENKHLQQLNDELTKELYALKNYGAEEIVDVDNDVDIVVDAEKPLLRSICPKKL
jgi:uncharacterized protein YPO0396